MSLFPKTCPHCDAGPGPYVNSYLCGTYLRAGVDARKHQTKRCVTGQMYALVERARKAEARCKRLEEAMKLVAEMRQRWLEMEDDGYAGAYYAFVKGKDDEWDAIMQAKEAKP